MAEVIKHTTGAGTAANVQLYGADGEPIYLDDLTGRLDTIITLLTAIAQGGGITPATSKVTTEGGDAITTEGGDNIVP
jgi:hypothetical protein